MDLQARRQLPLFSIGMVQKLTGLSARQIRYYEQHELVHPARSEGKQRQFSYADVERLMEVRRLLDDGLTMAGVKSRLLATNRGNGASIPEPELSDEEVYKRVQQELLEGPSTHMPSMLQGQLSRFYPRR